MFPSVSVSRQPSREPSQLLVAALRERREYKELYNAVTIVAQTKKQFLLLEGVSIMTKTNRTFCLLGKKKKKIK